MGFAQLTFSDNIQISKYNIQWLPVWLCSAVEGTKKVHKSKNVFRSHFKNDLVRFGGVLRELRGSTTSTLRIATYKMTFQI